jgi:hypothetical protein
LDNGDGNTLNNLIFSGTGAVPDGATFTKWDSSGNTFLPLSIYSSFSDSWSIDYSLAFEEGGVLNSTTHFTNTLVGTLVSYSNITPDFGGPIWAPNYPDGIHLIACPEPLGGAISFMFTNVTGRLPEDGEWVKLLNPATQTYTTTTYDAFLDAWDNGNPTLGVGQSAWFNLGPVIPEPSTLAVAGLAGTCLFIRRRQKP